MTRLYMRTSAEAHIYIIKFLPDGAERVPDNAFRTERGRAVRDREPGRFRRDRLAAVLDVYRKQLAKLNRI